MLAFDRPQVKEKLKFLESDLQTLRTRQAFKAPDIPARDIELLPVEMHPPKVGLSFPEGQARLLHDLASIELQAMELGLRTLAEFPQAPEAFREELIAVTRSEGEHLSLCIGALEKTDFPWGTFPVHVSLWSATSSVDSLLDRVLIVHRYLEGGGLDAGDHILRRLNGVKATAAVAILEKIRDDEIGHVYFGSHWYREICELENLDPEKDFETRMWSLKKILPRRIEKISVELRKRAGFTDHEIKVCQDLREHFLSAIVVKA